jgi:hypothetical protein
VTPTRTLTLEELLDTTPDADPNFTQDPGRPNRFTTPTHRPTPTEPPFVTVSGVQVPIPVGSHHYYGLGASDTTLFYHQIWFGDANFIETERGSVPLGVGFDESGLLFWHLEPGDEDEFAATFDAVWTITQNAGISAPPSLDLGGNSLPLPPGSSLKVTEGMAYGQVPFVWYSVRTRRSVLWFERLRDGRYVPARQIIAPEDAAAFQPTLDALADVLWTATPAD